MKYVGQLSSITEQSASNNSSTSQNVESDCPSEPASFERQSSKSGVSNTDGERCEYCDTHCVFVQEFITSTSKGIEQRDVHRSRVPTAPGKPGKMMKGFPVMEIWNFEILQNIMEK